MESISLSQLELERTQLNSLTVSGWLRVLLTIRGLSLPNGQPLFKYQLSEFEYHQLRNILKNHNLSARLHKDKSWCAAFCLFCAEWYRRVYQGLWSWNGISTSLGFELDANQRSKIIQCGFEYWRRPVSQYNDDRHSFLGSVFREGGLPYGLLATEGGRFQSIFKRILRVYDEAKAFGQSPFQLVSESLDHLPKAFRQETTVDLITNMAELLLRLTDEYNLHQQSQPAEHLDSQLPNWRNLFPIPLDGEMGSEFLAGLLTSATHQRRDKLQQTQRVICAQRLADSDKLEFVSLIKLMKSISMPFNRQELLNSRVELFIYEGNQVIAELGVGHTIFEGESTMVILRTSTCEFRRQSIEKDLYLVVLQAGTELHREEISNSGLPVNEMPIVLKSDGEYDWVIGVGSISKKAEQLKVILPKHASYSSASSEMCTLIDKENFQCLQFSGELVVKYDSEDNHEDHYFISTRHSALLSEQVSIRGEQLQYHSSTGQPIYLGLPIIKCNETNTELFIGKELIGKTYKSSLFGIQSIRLKAEGNRTLYRKKLAILPQSFSINLKPSDRVNSGFVELYSKSNFSVSVIGDALSFNQYKIEGGKQIKVTTEGAPPADIILAIRANLLAESIKIRVPFPASGALLFDQNGKNLARRVTIDDLLGARIQLFPRIGVAAQYYIELKGPLASREASYFWEYKVTDRILEVSLYEFRHQIRELLSASGELDDEVRMVIGGTGCREKLYIIGRYAVEAQLENSTVSFDIKLNNEQRIRPELINLTDPAEKPHSLQQRYSHYVPTGVFELGRSLSQPALLVPSKSSQLTFRAKFIPGIEPVKLSYNVKTLNKAVALFHPQFNSNAIADVLQLMSNDFNHSSWRFVNDLFAHYSHLPMATFEVWKAMVKHTSCLAALAFKADNPVLLMDRLLVEFNVIWELVPLSLWRSHTAKYRQMLLDIGLPKAVVVNRVNSKLEELSVFSPLFGVDCCHLVVNQSNLKQTNFAVIFEYCLPGWSQDLVRLHLSDSAWPTEFANELENWCQKHCHSLIHFDVQRYFHKSVLYFPIFAAAVACGKAQLEELVPVLHPIHYFYLRQIAEFDRQWFNPLFKSALCLFAQEEVK